MRVNIFQSTRPDRLPTAAPDDQCAANVDLMEAFPGPENGDEYLLAHGYLERDGRYWAGGGAAPIFLIMKAE